MKLLFRYKSEGLAEDGPECSGIQFPVFWKGPGLLAGGSHSAEREMASAGHERQNRNG